MALGNPSADEQDDPSSLEGVRHILPVDCAVLDTPPAHCAVLGKSLVHCAVLGNPPAN